MSFLSKIRRKRAKTNHFKAKEGRSKTKGKKLLLLKAKKE
jgi:hypothetical protein